MQGESTSVDERNSTDSGSQISAVINESNAMVIYRPPSTQGRSTDVVLNNSVPAPNQSADSVTSYNDVPDDKSNEMEVYDSDGDVVESDTEQPRPKRQKRPPCPPHICAKLGKGNPTYGVCGKPMPPETIGNYLRCPSCRLEDIIVKKRSNDNIKQEMEKGKKVRSQV